MSTPALEVVGLAKSFGGVCAASEVSFAVPHGSLAALIGPNGAGKTTIFNHGHQPLCTGLARRGALLRCAARRDAPPAQIAALGLVRTFRPRRVLFPGMTTLENVHHRARICT